MTGLFKRLGRQRFSSLWQMAMSPRLAWTIFQGPPTLSPVEAVRSLLPEIDLKQIQACRIEFLKSGQFFADIEERTLDRRDRRALWQNWHTFAYMMVRLSKPKIVIETGTFDGQSTAAMLHALAKNDDGLLVSIDLPAVEEIHGSTHRMTETSLPTGCQPGWVIPDHLRDRHRLVLGDARQLLPQLLETDYPSIDIFIHDSLHTFDHQYFEYTTAWPHLPSGRFLMSDDIYWNRAYPLFCKHKSIPFVRVGTFGAAIKP